MSKKMRFENILDESLDRVLYGEAEIDSIIKTYPGLENQLKSALETAQWLADQRNQLTPRHGFIQSTKQYITTSLLVTNLRRDYAFKAFERRVLFRGILFSFVVISILFLAGAGSFMVVNESVPGDVFFPVRIAAENVRLALTLQPSKEAFLHLQFAQEHLVACALLVSQGQHHQAQVALKHYEHHMVGAGRLIPVFTQSGLNADQLFSDFNRIFIQDIETIQVLFPGDF